MVINYHYIKKIMIKPTNFYYLFSIFATLFCVIIIFTIPLKIFANSNNVSNDSVIMTTKGIELNKIGKFNESIGYFDKALAMDPKNAVALNERGNAFGGLGNYDQALDSYDKALSLNPQNATILDNKGVVFVKG